LRGVPAADGHRVRHDLAQGAEMVDGVHRVGDADAVKARHNREHDLLDVVIYVNLEAQPEGIH
jgi:hypothetical protein